jgi:hypothetical protein
MTSSRNLVSLLQQGVSAARSGRTAEARDALQRVVAGDPHNETAWLWLSGLVETDAEKRDCLERVLRANPDNAYAQAGLARLAQAQETASDELESRLRQVTSDGARNGTADGQPKRAGSIRRLVPSPQRERMPGAAASFGETTASGEAVSEEPVSREPILAERLPSESLPEESPPADPRNPSETLCPICDQPIEMMASECPHCFWEFKSLDELLGRNGRKAPPATNGSAKRKGMLGHLLSVFAG